MPRRPSKPEIEIPRKASFHSADGTVAAGWIVRLSVVGMEVESLLAPPSGTNVTVRAELVDGEGELEFPGRVQWVTATRFGVQFLSLGARETHAVLRASPRSRPAA